MRAGKGMSMSPHFDYYPMESVLQGLQHCRDAMTDMDRLLMVSLCLLTREKRHRVGTHHEGMFGLSVVDIQIANRPGLGRCHRHFTHSASKPFLKSGNPVTKVEL